MILQRTLPILLASALLALATTLSGCCCGGDFAEKIAEEAAEKAIEEAEKAEAEKDDEGDEGDEEKADEGDDEDDKDDKKADKDDEGDEDDKDDKKADKGGDGPQDVKDITPESLAKSLESAGWEVISKTDTKTTFVLSVKKGSIFASVQIMDMTNNLAAKASEKALKDNGGAVARDGKRLIVVLVPNNPEKSKELLSKVAKS